MLTVIMPGATILSVEFSYFYADCHYADWGIFLIVMLTVDMLCVIILSAAISYRYADCR